MEHIFYLIALGIGRLVLGLILIVIVAAISYAINKSFENSLDSKPNWER